MYILGLFKFFFDASYALRAETKSLLLPNSDIIVQNNICACGRRHAYLQDVISSDSGEQKVRHSQRTKHEIISHEKEKLEINVK